MRINTKTFLSGIGIGAGLMYLLDPDRGKRRRSLVQDQVVRGWGKAGDAIQSTAQDVGNRARGLGAEARSLLSRGTVPNDVLEQRVRARVGRVAAHPGSITVAAQDGVITLSGSAPEGEIAGVVRSISSVRGVTNVVNSLEVREGLDNTPGQHGSLPRREPKLEFIQGHWSPTARVLMGLAGGALIFYGVRRRGPFGTAISTVGAGILARGVTNRGVKRMVEVGTKREALEVRETGKSDEPVAPMPVSTESGTLPLDAADPGMQSVEEPNTAAETGAQPDLASGQTPEKKQRQQRRGGPAG